MYRRVGRDGVESESVSAPWNASFTALSSSVNVQRLDVAAVVEQPEVVGVESHQSSHLAPTQTSQVRRGDVVRRAHGQRVAMDRARHDRRRHAAVQRLPQLRDLRAEPFQLDDVVVVDAARSTEVGDGRPVRVEAIGVVEAFVGQKANELDERHVVLGAVGQRRPASVSVVHSPTSHVGAHLQLHLPRLFVKVFIYKN